MKGISDKSKGSAIRSVLAGMEDDCRRGTFTGPDGAFLQKAFENTVVKRVWKQLLRAASGEDPDTVFGYIRPEDVVLALLRMGIAKKDIHYYDNVFRVNLPNHVLRMERKAGGIVPSGQLKDFSAEDYASLAMWFGSVVPEIKSEAAGLCRAMKQEAMARQIQMKAVCSVMGDFLEGRDYSEFSWSVNDDGTVNVQARIVEERKVSDAGIPLDRLRDSLEEMAARIETMPPERKHGINPDLLTWY